MARVNVAVAVNRNRRRRLHRRRRPHRDDMPEPSSDPLDLAGDSRADFSRADGAAAAPVGDHRRQAWLECADAAAGTVRVLIHIAVSDADALAGPADVYALLGALARLGGRLPHALHPLLDVIATEYVAGTLQVLRGPHAGAPAAALTDLTRQLCWAATSAHALSAALEQGEDTLTWAATARRD
jgi:hypothetical protein